ncbi:MAG: DUF222 domain-containing protein, partial [Myxococcaceae bacterium]|nr:DUF222 domain-containing protein [Myxococcaceae bacterium]
WSELPKDLPEVILTGAPPDDAGAHERVQFYSAVMGRLDAVRGRLLRVVEDRRHAGRLRFSGVGQYVRERMGLSFWEARDLIRLDRALTDLPLAFRMYAAGKLGRRAAWLVTRVAHLGGSRTEAEWVRYAMTHTLRVLEAAVDAMLRRFQTDREGWLEGGNRPPVGASFGEVLRAFVFPLRELPEHGDAAAGDDPRRGGHLRGGAGWAERGLR